MRREPVFSSLDFESPRASDQRYVDSRQFEMLSSAQFRETPVSTASGSLSVHQGSSICSLPPNWLRSISSASGRRSESIGIYRLNFRAIIRQKRTEDPGKRLPGDRKLCRFSRFECKRLPDFDDHHEVGSSQTRIQQSPRRNSRRKQGLRGGEHRLIRYVLGERER